MAIQPSAQKSKHALSQVWDDSTIDKRIGGRAIVRELKLVRLPIDRQGREWSLDPTEIDSMFDRRFIRRSDAARLDKPTKSKR